MISSSGAPAPAGMQAAAVLRNNCCLPTMLNTAVYGVDVGEVGRYKWVASEDLG